MVCKTLHKSFFAVLLLAVPFAGACGGAQLENDEFNAEDPAFQIDEEAGVKDKPKVRSVLEVLARYRKAVVNKDFGVIRQLISKDYYENAGTTDTTEDDYGWAELKEKILEMMAEHTKEIRYEILVKKVEIKGERASVEYEYDFAYRYEVGQKPSWDAGLEANQIRLVKEGGDWKIVSGL